MQRDFVHRLIEASLVFVILFGVVAMASESVAERPRRIRAEERDQLREEHAEKERLGKEIERIREVVIESGEDAPDIDELKEMAEQKLHNASETFTKQEWKGEWQDGPKDQWDKPKKVCFRPDGSVTDNRDECDPDQGHHFGMPEPPSFAPGDGIMPPPQGFEERMEHKFGPPPDMIKHGPPLLDIIAEALHRLSGTLQHIRGDAEAEAKIRETISWLSTILADYSAQEPAPDQQKELAMQIHDRLRGLMEVMPGPGRPPDFDHGPPIEKILEKMEHMMAKIPQVIAIFEEEGIPVAPEAREAYEEAKVHFEELREKCKNNPQECERMKEVFMILEDRMRPPMEMAIKESGRFDVMEKIDLLMREDEEDEFHRGPPPWDDDEWEDDKWEDKWEEEFDKDWEDDEWGDDEFHRGPPSDFPGKGYGPPNGFPPGKYGPPPWGKNMMPHKFGPPPGKYGPPPWDKNMMPPDYGPPYDDYGPPPWEHDEWEKKDWEEDEWNEEWKDEEWKEDEWNEEWKDEEWEEDEWEDYEDDYENDEEWLDESQQISE